MKQQSRETSKRLFSYYQSLFDNSLAVAADVTGAPSNRNHSSSLLKPCKVTAQTNCARFSPHSSYLCFNFKVEPTKPANSRAVRSPVVMNQSLNATFIDLSHGAHYLVS